MKNARRKFEIPMPASMPCKTSLCRSSREAAPSEDTRQNTLVLLKQTNLPESMWKDLWREFIESSQSSAQIYTYASSNENTRCKSSSAKKKKTRENTGMAADERQKQK